MSTFSQACACRAAYSSPAAVDPISTAARGRPAPGLSELRDAAANELLFPFGKSGPVDDLCRHAPDYTEMSCWLLVASC